MLKRREDELITSMRSQLVKGHAQMKRQTAEAVEAAVASQKSEITGLEGDCQHFSTSRAQVMNEVTALRNKYEDWEEWDEAGEEEYEVEGDELSKCTETIPATAMQRGSAWTTPRG